MSILHNILLASGLWTLHTAPAIANAPSDDVGLLDQVLASMAKGRYDEAAAQVVQALAATPEGAHAMKARLHCLRVQALHRAGRTCEARKDLEGALAARKQMRGGSPKVGQCLKRLDDARRALATCSGSRPRCREGMAYIGGGTHAKKKIRGFCLDVHEVTVGDFRQYIATLESGVTPKQVAKRTVEEIRGLRSSLSRVHGVELGGRDKADLDRNCNWPRGEKVDEHPINCVSVVEAERYCRSLGKRLPNRLQWKWAARGGGLGRTYPGRFSKPSTIDMHMAAAPDDVFKSTVKVGQFPPSDFELHDMAGNVAEWTACDASAVSCSASGGHFREYDESRVRVTYELTGMARDARSDVIGFRCAAPAVRIKPEK